ALKLFDFRGGIVIDLLLFGGGIFYRHSAIRFRYFIRLYFGFHIYFSDIIPLIVEMIVYIAKTTRLAQYCFPFDIVVTYHSIKDQSKGCEGVLIADGLKKTDKILFSPLLFKQSFQLFARIVSTKIDVFDIIS